MASSTALLLLLLSIAALAAVNAGDALATPLEHFGFNPRIKWLSFADAKSAAQETRKPVLVAIWLPGDEHTEEFRKMFDDDRVERLSSSFHMVTAPWGSDSAAAKHWDLYPFVYGVQMDGAYTPRVVFLHKGKVQLITNRDLMNYRWYYYHPDSLVRSMEEAVEVFLYGAELKPPADWSPPAAPESETLSVDSAGNAVPAPTPALAKPAGVKDAGPAAPKPIKAKTLLERKAELAKLAKEIHELEENEKKSGVHAEDIKKDEL